MNSSPSNQQILEELRQMDWDEFEELVAEHWEERGWNTRVTSGSQDRGIDIEATKHNPAKSKLLIQAKRHQQGNKVSAPRIQQYAGLLHTENNVDTVYVVTTSSFTRQAKETADDTQVKLINGQKLARQLSDQLITEWFGDTANLSNSTNNKNKKTQSRKSEIRISDSDANSLPPRNTGSDSDYPEYINGTEYIYGSSGKVLIISTLLIYFGGVVWLTDSISILPNNAFGWFIGNIIFAVLLILLLLFLALVGRLSKVLLE